MKKSILLFFLFFVLQNAKGQNLVPNGDFEQYSNCPDYLSQIDSALFWTNPCVPPYGTTGTYSGSSDYLNSCTSSPVIGVPSNNWGFQQAHSGNGYAGLYAYFIISVFREYIETALSSPLLSQECYHLELYINLADDCQFTLDTIGVYFSNTLLTNFHSHDTLPFIPQLKLNSGFISDTMNWMLLSGNYTAAGGEAYLTIGNFNGDANTNLLTVFPAGNSIIYLYIDDVTLTPCTAIEEQNQNEAITIYPNPVKDELNVHISIPIAIGTNFQTNKAEIIITDILGKEILRNQFSNSKFQIPTSGFNNGIYFIEIITGKDIFRKKFLKK